MRLLAFLGLGVLVVGVAIYALFPRPSANLSQTDTTHSDIAGQAPNLLSAFFGLDHAMPRIADWICFGAAGQNGMPVVFPLEQDIGTLQAGDFSVHTESGQKKSVFCVTPAPALDDGELRTILLIGDYGSDEDPAIKVEIVGNLPDKTRQQNFKGRTIEDIPLQAGPELILAQEALKHEWSQKNTRATSCPSNSQQVVRVT